VCVILPQDNTYLGSLLNGVIILMFNLSDTIPFWILIVPFLYTFVTGYGTVEGVDNFRRIPGVSNNTWSPTLYSYIH
jgi:hypothetical protein